MWDNADNVFSCTIWFILYIYIPCGASGYGRMVFSFVAGVRRRMRPKGKWQSDKLDKLHLLPPLEKSSLITLLEKKIPWGPPPTCCGSFLRATVRKTYQNFDFVAERKTISLFIYNFLHILLLRMKETWCGLFLPKAL